MNCPLTNRSEGFPLAGLFHPWAQWDLGLDTLENYSRRVVVAPWGSLARARALVVGFTREHQTRRLASDYNTFLRLED